MSEQLINEIRETLASARSQFEYLSDLGFESQKKDAPEAALAIIPAAISLHNISVHGPAAYIE